MRRRTFLLGIAGAASACVTSHTRRLNVCNWDNYVARNTIPSFEHEFDCRVRYATYSSAEEMLARVMSGNSGWDVVFPSNSFVGPMHELGLLEKLDHSRLTNLSNLEERFQHPDWDASLDWCVPYMHSATGILYSQAVSRVPRSWADLWTDNYRGRLTMLDDPAEVFGAALKRLGCSVNSTDAQQLMRARDLAIAQKPLLRAYLSEEVRDQVAAGDVLVAQLWAQVAQVAMDEAPNLRFSFPSEGFPLYADNSCILRESSHKEMAYQFVNYLLRAQIACSVALEMRTATANGAARALLPVAQRSNPVLYPPADVLARGEWFCALPSSAQRLRDRYWTEIKSA